MMVLIMTKGKGDPLAVRLPTIRMDNGKDKQPKDRCGICGRPLVQAAIDHGGTVVIKKRSVGRPKKGSTVTRREVIGTWCKRDKIFYYPNLSPNYKVRNAR